MVNAAAIAAQFDVSRARVTQWVQSGKLDGCYTGTGRARRFDVRKVAKALGRNLEPGQMLTRNGAGTLERIEKLRDRAEPDADAGDLLPATDADRYRMAQTLKAEEQARTLRRQNAEAEGMFVLAANVELEVRRQIGQEIAEFESVFRDAARAVADKFGIDVRECRQIMIESWRAHRRSRAAQAASAAEGATLTPDERDADT